MNRIFFVKIKRKIGYKTDRRRFSHAYKRFNSVKKRNCLKPRQKHIYFIYSARDINKIDKLIHRSHSGRFMPAAISCLNYRAKLSTGLVKAPN